MLAKLIEKRGITTRDTLYTFSCPPIAQKATPGQFVEIKVTAGIDPFLRRPVSIFDADGQDTFSLLVRAVGQGTAIMSAWEPGTQVDVLGPLGHGFTWDSGTKTCVLAAGGIGLAPMGFLARQLLDAGRQVKLLFSPRRDSTLLDTLPFLDRLEVCCPENRTALPSMLDGLLGGADALFACGPEGMLETSVQRAIAAGVPCQLSLEQRMACGIGICLGCAVALRTPDSLTYKKACKDGPVFRGEEVAFHEKP